MSELMGSPKQGIDCPLCGEWIELKRIVSSFAWICDTCPFASFEYYTRQDSEDVSNYLNGDI